MDLSDNHREILKQFRSNLADILNPDHTDAILVKYLRARNFNLKKAEINYREVQMNRLVYEIDKIVDSYEPPEVFRYRGDAFLGYAKDGSPIRYITAKVDFYGFLQSVSTYNLSLYFVNTMENDAKALKEENMRTGRKNNEVTYIFDLEGYSLMQLTHKPVIEIGLDSMRLLQDHYPEIWKNIFMVNAPFVYEKVFNIFKPILKDSFVEKIKVVSKNDTGEVLRQYIDEDVLPAFLGGERVDSKGDIYCKEFINQGGTIPEKYFLRNYLHYKDENDPGVKVVTIGARSVFNVPMIARQTGEKFRLEMRTENGSLIFSVLYREFGPEPDNPDLPASDEYLDPYDERCNVRCIGTRLRTHSHIAPNDGYGAIIDPGIYILQFDNTDSWFTSRKLFYRVSMYLPND